MVEVMVALFIMVLSLVAITKLYVESVDAEAYSDNLTFASILAQEKLQSLVLLPRGSPELTSTWHADTSNPVYLDKRPFWRFWLVKNNDKGKGEVTVYVWWNSRKRHNTRNSTSALDFDKSSCPCISIKGWVAR